MAVKNKHTDVIFEDYPDTFIDITGIRFGKLSVIGQDLTIKEGWMCVCDCGKTITKTIVSLVAYKTKSCGCYRLEKISSHGLSKHPLYSVYNDMFERCDNPNSTEYKNYGYRGIGICQEWRNGFKAFYDWAIQSGYKKGLQLDRFPNNDGDYTPDNCRWATPKENQNNKRNNVFITHMGETKTASQWGHEKGIHPSVIIYRYKNGYSDDKIFLPQKKYKCQKQHKVL